MAATLFAVVLALLLGHGLPGLTGIRDFGWLKSWGGWLQDRLSRPERSPNAWLLLPLIGLPVLAVLVLQLGLRDGWLASLIGFVFATAILFYCWGPRDLDVDVERIVEAESQGERLAAAQTLWPENGQPSLNGPALVEAVFRGALRRWFGVLFWFLLLGPAGAVLYRLTALTAEDALAQALNPDSRDAANDLLRILDWPAAQLTTLGLALAANFDSVMAAWRDWHAGGFGLDSGFLGAAARACVASEIAAERDEDEHADALATIPALAELRDAMSLAWRVLLLWLAVLALFVLAGWVD